MVYFHLLSVQQASQSAGALSIGALFRPPGDLPSLACIIGTEAQGGNENYIVSTKSSVSLALPLSLSRDKDNSAGRNAFCVGKYRVQYERIIKV